MSSIIVSSVSSCGFGRTPRLRRHPHRDQLDYARGAVGMPPTAPTTCCFVGDGDRVNATFSKTRAPAILPIIRALPVGEL